MAGNGRCHPPALERDANPSPSDNSLLCENERLYEKYFEKHPEKGFKILIYAPMMYGKTYVCRDYSFADTDDSLWFADQGVCVDNLPEECEAALNRVTKADVVVTNIPSLIRYAQIGVFFMPNKATYIRLVSLRQYSCHLREYENDAYWAPYYAYNIGDGSYITEHMRLIASIQHLYGMKPCDVPLPQYTPDYSGLWMINNDGLLLALDTKSAYNHFFNQGIIEDMEFAKTSSGCRLSVKIYGKTFTFNTAHQTKRAASKALALKSMIELEEYQKYHGICAQRVVYMQPNELMLRQVDTQIVTPEATTGMSMNTSPVIAGESISPRAGVETLNALSAPHMPTATGRIENVISRMYERPLTVEEVVITPETATDLPLLSVSNDPMSYPGDAGILFRAHKYCTPGIVVSIEVISGPGFIGRMQVTEVPDVKAAEKLGWQRLRMFYPNKEITLEQSTVHHYVLIDKRLTGVTRQVVDDPNPWNGLLIHLMAPLVTSYRAIAGDKTPPSVRLIVSTFLSKDATFFGPEKSLAEASAEVVPKSCVNYHSGGAFNFRFPRVVSFNVNDNTAPNVNYNKLQNTISDFPPTKKCELLPLHWFKHSYHVHAACSWADYQRIRLPIPFFGYGPMPPAEIDMYFTKGTLAECLMTAFNAVGFHTALLGGFPHITNWNEIDDTEHDDDETHYYPFEGKRQVLRIWKGNSSFWLMVPAINSGSGHLDANFEELAPIDYMSNPNWNGSISRADSVESSWQTLMEINAPSEKTTTWISLGNYTDLTYNRLARMDFLRMAKWDYAEYSVERTQPAKNSSLGNLAGVTLTRDRIVQTAITNTMIPPDDLHMQFCDALAEHLNSVGHSRVVFDLIFAGRIIAQMMYSDSLGLVIYPTVMNKSLYSLRGDDVSIGDMRFNDANLQATATEDWSINKVLVDQVANRPFTRQAMLGMVAGGMALQGLGSGLEAYAMLAMGNKQLEWDKDKFRQQQDLTRDQLAQQERHFQQTQKFRYDQLRNKTLFSNASIENQFKLAQWQEDANSINMQNSTILRLYERGMTSAAVAKGGSRGQHFLGSAEILEHPDIETPTTVVGKHLSSEIVTPQNSIPKGDIPPPTARSMPVAGVTTSESSDHQITSYNRNSHGLGADPGTKVKDLKFPDLPHGEKHSISDPAISTTIVHDEELAPIFHTPSVKVGAFRPPIVGVPKRGPLTSGNMAKD